MLERVQALSLDDTRPHPDLHNPALEGVLRAAQRAGLTMPPARQNGSHRAISSTSSSSLTFRLKRAQRSALAGVAARSSATRRLGACRTPASGTSTSSRSSSRAPAAAATGVAAPAARWSCLAVMRSGTSRPRSSRMPSWERHTESCSWTALDRRNVLAHPGDAPRFAGIKDVKLIHRWSMVCGRTARRRRGRTRRHAPARQGRCVSQRVRRRRRRRPHDPPTPPHGAARDLAGFFNAIASGKPSSSRQPPFVPHGRACDEVVELPGQQVFFGKVFTWLLGKPIRDTLSHQGAATRDLREDCAGRPI